MTDNTTADQRQKAAQALDQSRQRVMFAAWVDIRRGDPDAALRLLGDHLEGACDIDGPEWEAGETGAQWLAKATAGPQGKPESQGM